MATGLKFSFRRFLLTLAVGLVSCDRNEQVNSVGVEDNSAVNTSSTATGERLLIVATTSIPSD